MLDVPRGHPPKRVIEIRDNRTPAWFRRLVATCLLSVLPIYIGIHFGSVVMEVVGFIWGSLLIWSMGWREVGTSTFKNIDDAIRHLKVLKGP